MVSEAVDSAARYLLYKLYDATAGRPDAWQACAGFEDRSMRPASGLSRHKTSRQTMDCRKQRDSGSKARKAASFVGLI